MSKPIKIYKPRPVSPLLLLAIGVGIPLIIFRNIGGDILEPPVLVLVGALSVGLASYVGVFAGRKWIHLYDDRLEIRGPISNLLLRLFGLDLCVDKISYREVVALGRCAYESKRGSYLIIHRARGRKRERFRLECTPLEKYLDLKAEVLKKIPPSCELYSLKGLGVRGPW